MEEEPVLVVLPASTSRSASTWAVRLRWPPTTAIRGTDPVADDALLDRLGVEAGVRLVDLACGTGSLVVQAARRGAEAHGVDVSQEMLAFARARAERAGAGAGAHWHRAGFLDYAHRAGPADVVTTKSALHQLPISEAAGAPQRGRHAAAGRHLLPVGRHLQFQSPPTPQSIWSDGSTRRGSLRARASRGRISRRTCGRSSPPTHGS
ncbi:class I SAM-dependent methyltransferase [Streptomyces sp. KL116D]|uniref:class I SAM-dependent methyltransferase n=1 Tax=Streptomyces sp. KL116D TaxID=3045152 RepID=UPI003556C24E